MSPVMSYLAFTATALFTATSNAHMILGSPPPYGSPDNSPLVADGSNFPCKATSNTGATVTEMSIGAQQPLWFIGSAVHGGGSCQISLTTDTPATKNSNWMVIHSIEGGCPAKTATGNAGAGTSGGSNYTYTIPEGITPGAYTLAWTWFNKIGNREMYMNCASVKISGGSNKRAATLNETLGISELSERATASFPAMFKANIPTSDCETVDSADVQFPDPGTSVDKFGSGTLTPPTGSNCGSSGSGSSSNSSASAAGSSAPASASSASGSSGSGSSGSNGAAPSPSMAASGASGSTAPSAAPSVAPLAQPVDSAAPSMAAAPAIAAAPSSAPSAMTNSSSGSTTPSTSSTGTSTGTCSSAGQSICSPDGKQIGMCTAQLTVTWIPVASGTKCSGGYQVFAKRSSAKFQRGYVRRGETLGVW